MEEKTKEKKSNAGTIIFVIVLFIVVIGGILLFLYYGRNTNDDPEVIEDIGTNFVGNITDTINKYILSRDKSNQNEVELLLNSDLTLDKNIWYFESDSGKINYIISNKNGNLIYYLNYSGDNVTLDLEQRSQWAIVSVGAGKYIIRTSEQDKNLNFDELNNVILQDKLEGEKSWFITEQTPKGTDEQDDSKDEEPVTIKHYVWGLTSDQSLVRCTYPCKKGNWNVFASNEEIEEKMGDLVKIEVDNELGNNNYLYLINSSGELYRQKLPSDIFNPEIRTFPVNIKQISTGDPLRLWAVSTDNGLFRATKPNGGWSNMGITANFVSASHLKNFKPYVVIMKPNGSVLHNKYPADDSSKFSIGDDLINVTSYAFLSGHNYDYLVSSTQLYLIRTKWENNTKNTKDRKAYSGKDFIPVVKIVVKDNEYVYILGPNGNVFSVKNEDLIASDKYTKISGEYNFIDITN